LVWRKIWENPIGSRAKYLAVFLYILSHANTTEKKIIINNETITIKRGQWLGSLRQIANHFELSTGTVSYILKYLKVEHIVEHTTTKKFTLFTVPNFDKYQPHFEHKFENKLKQLIKDNKDIYNIYKGGKGKTEGEIRKTMDYLKPNHISLISKKISLEFGVSEEFVKTEASIALDWLVSRGRRYKDYAAFFRNWLRKAIKLNPSVVKKDKPAGFVSAKELKERGLL